MTEVRAYLRSLRMSPRKVRLVVDVIRGLSVVEAERRLQFVRKHAAKPVLKLLRSAVANAEHNAKLDKKHLFIKTIVADGGPTLKRWRPAAMGAAHPIRKRTTHISIVLAQTVTSPEQAPKKAERAKQSQSLRT